VNCGDYSIQSGNSLYSTYDGQLFQNGIGPNATEVDVQFGRWLDGIQYKADMDFFYTEQAPSVYIGGADFSYPVNSAFYPFSSLTKEHSGGAAFDLQGLAQSVSSGNHQALLDGKARVAIEYVQRLNYGAPGSVRALLSLSIGLTPLWRSFQLQ